MLTVEEALEAILSRIGRLETERVDLAAALGRALAERIVARRDIPPWCNSSMDGYAVRARDTGVVELRVVDRIVAGALPSRPLRSGEAMRIFTGAPLPDGADAVVPQEDVVATETGIRLNAEVPAGAYVRPAGEDLRRGDVVLDPGSTLTPAAIGLLATLGYRQVCTGRRPRVSILSTGNELADLGADPGPGQIPNTNTYTLMAQVIEAGGEPTVLGVAADRLDDIRERLAWGLSADVLLSSAGVSVGELDLVRDAMVALGADLHLWRVSMRPGKPITFGSLGGRPVFGLPGNPVSAMVTFEIFVRPALRKMAGHRTLQRGRLVARAFDAIPNPGSRRGYLRVTLGRDRDSYTARLTGDQGSGILRSMVAADGLAIVPGDTTIEAGQSLEVMLLREL